MSVTQNTSKTKKNVTTTTPNYKKYIFAMWLIYFLGVSSIFLLFRYISNGGFGELPSFVELESPTSALASEIYSADNVLLGKFFIEDRSNSSFDELPQHLVDALITTEDVRFYNHSGIDLRSLSRAIFFGLTGENRGGASTISQQLALNLFDERSPNITERIKQKFKEWVIAVRLERSYTKEEILTMYLNTVPFGYNAHGVKAAAYVFFDSSPDSLKVQEAAVLVGMLKANTLYNPKRNPNNSKKRRNVVLEQMAKYDKLTVAERDSLQELPIELRFNRTTHDEGLATYFRDYVKSYLKNWAEDEDNKKLDGTNYNIFKDGLKIYTTLDSRMQQHAEEAVSVYMADLQKQFYKHWGKKNPWDDSPRANLKKDDLWYGTNELIYRAAKQSGRYNMMKSSGASEEQIKKAFETPTEMSVFSWNGERDTTLTPLDSLAHYKRILHTGFMSIDPSNGHIKAWVGDINHKHFKYDNVRPSSKQQVGSTFKPFVYALAMDNGWSPCHLVPNVPVTFEDFDNWTPENAGSLYDGQKITLETGLAHSINRITAYLMKQLSPQQVVDLAKAMGIESHMDPYPSICLGTPDISVYEMIGAYGTFANKGFYNRPIAILRLEDKNGNEIRTFPTFKREAINEHAAYAMISLLKGVTNKGTAIRLRTKYGFYNEIAGKTGTTDDNSDGWFIGITPKLVSGAWVGGDEKAIRFRTTALGSGSNMSLPIWAEFMKRVYADESLGISKEDYFERPPNMSIELDCEKYGPVPTETAEGETTADPNDPNASPTDPNTTTEEEEDFDYNDQFDVE